MGYGLLVVAISGAIVAIFATDMLLADRGADRFFLWNGIGGALGATWSTVLCLKWLGHEGRWGLLHLILGFLIISFLTSVAAGTLILPLYGTMFGPFGAIMTFFNTPQLAIVWCGAIVGAHLQAIKWRRERDSIFAVELPQPDEPLRY